MPNTRDLIYESNIIYKNEEYDNLNETFKSIIKDKNKFFCFNDEIVFISKSKYIKINEYKIEFEKLKLENQKLRNKLYRKSIRYSPY